MKENTPLIKIYCSPFVFLSSDWESLRTEKFSSLSIQISWVKEIGDADIVIIPSHISPKSKDVFNSFLQTVPAQSLLLIYPEVLSRVTELIDVTTQQLFHRLSFLSSAALLPEEIIHELNKNQSGTYGV